MERGRWQKRFFIVIALTGILHFAAEIVFVAPAYSSEDINVNCYLKGDDDYVYIGNLDIFDVSRAAYSCNDTYMDCQGKCIGCYIGDDGQEYCYDAAGRKFQK